jgi:actin related protein 2/3 complex subunit 5
MANINWRTINVDLLDPESPSNFPTASLTPSVPPVSIAEVQGLAAQVKQLLRGGDAEGALRGALENPPYGGDAGAKVRSTPSSVIAERPRYSGETTVSSVKSDYSADVRPKEVHLSTVVETLQSIKQSDMSPMLHKIYDSDDGPETLDVLMKYLCV